MRTGAAAASWALWGALWASAAHGLRPGVHRQDAGAVRAPPAWSPELAPRRQFAVS